MKRLSLRSGPASRRLQPCRFPLRFIPLLGLAGALAAGEVTYKDLLNPAPENWLTYGGTYDSQRHTKLDQINPASVHRLAPAWIFPIASPRRLESVPLVVDGVMYVGHPNEVYALDAATGRQIWQYRRDPAEQRGNQRGVGGARQLGLHHYRRRPSGGAGRSNRQ